MSFPRILLIVSEPYRADSTSRYLSTFFGGWDPEKIAQIYTVDTLPTAGFCRRYYRMTDMEMIRSLFRREVVGKRIEVCEEEPKKNKKEKKDSRFFAFFKRFNDHPTMLYFRSLLWKRRRWDTEEFRRFVDEFDPEVLFLPMGRNLFDAEIALSLAKEKNIPLIAFSPDDYYYRYKSDFSPFSCLYRRRLSRLLKRLFGESAYILSVCDKMSRQYERGFGVSCHTVHFSSSIACDGQEERDPCRFAFLGSPGYGRWRTLLALGNALHAISDKYYIDVYAKPHDSEKYEKALRACPAIRLHDAVPYEEVMRVMKSSRFVLHVEDFKRKSKKETRYSLSTKISDCLASGALPVAIGPSDVGSIDYLLKSGAAFVCTDPKTLRDTLLGLLSDPLYEQELVRRAIAEAKEHCDPRKNQARFLALCQRAIKAHDAKK